MKDKIINFFKKSSVKILSSMMALSMFVTVPAFAEGASSDTSSVVTGITDGLTSGKADFVSALAAISGVAIGFFVVKFVVKQCIKYFSTIANKG